MVYFIIKIVHSLQARFNDLAPYVRFKTSNVALERLRFPTPALAAYWHAAAFYKANRKLFSSKVKHSEGLRATPSDAPFTRHWLFLPLHSIRPASVAVVAAVVVRADVPVVPESHGVPLGALHHPALLQQRHGPAFHQRRAQTLARLFNEPAVFKSRHVQANLVISSNETALAFLRTRFRPASRSKQRCSKWYRSSSFDLKGPIWQNKNTNKVSFSAICCSSALTHAASCQIARVGLCVSVFHFIHPKINKSEAPLLKSQHAARQVFCLNTCWLTAIIQMAVSLPCRPRWLWSFPWSAFILVTLCSRSYEVPCRLKRTLTSHSHKKKKKTESHTHPKPLTPNKILSHLPPPQKKSNTQWKKILY